MKLPKALLYRMTGLSLVLLGETAYFYHTGHFFSLPEAQAQPAAQAIPVDAMRLKNLTATVFKEMPGRISAYQMAEIRPQVTGIITDRLFSEGGSVEEGQQLYQIDPAPYKATYEKALADLKKAHANQNSIKTKSRRNKELLDINAVSKQEFDDIQASLAIAEADIAIAEAAVATAKINLDYTNVYAPISGRIGKSRVTRGALVTSNQEQALATITQLDPVYVDMTLSSTELMRFRPKLNMEKVPVVLVFEPGNKVYEHEGLMQFAEVTVNQTTGSVELRALFPNPDSVLLPGLFVRAQLRLEYPDSILVPQKATQRKADGSLSVWVLNQDNTVESRKIVAQTSVGSDWLVSSGISAGEVIVTKGTINLAAGSTVNPVITDQVQPQEQAVGN